MAASPILSPSSLRVPAEGREDLICSVPASSSINMMYIWLTTLLGNNNVGPDTQLVENHWVELYLVIAIFNI